jgi:hypothetical protein
MLGGLSIIDLRKIRGIAMGYFDAVTSAFFKTAADGRRLYFPWGSWGRGYVLASEHDYERLRRQIKIWQIAILVVIFLAPIITPIIRDQYGAIGSPAFVAPAIVVLLLGFQWLWSRSVVKHLQPSDERLSWQENMATQARLLGPGWLWLMEIVALVFVAGGIGIIVSYPSAWLPGFALTVLFGCCAAIFARMLLLRREQAD